MYNTSEIHSRKLKYSTIFRTITDDISGANKSIGLFGLSLKNVDDILYDMKTRGIKDTIFNTPTINIDKEAINKYNKRILAGVSAQEALTIASKNTNSATIALMKSANGTTISTEQMTAAQKASTVAAKAQSAAYKAVSVAANMIAYALIAKGIQLAADAIDHYVNRAKYAAEAMEEAQQAIDDAQSSLKNVFTTLSENKDRFLELSQGVDKFSKNLSLSEEDYAEYLSISNQLAELSPSLVSGYDEQGNALLAIGKNADETNEKLQSVLENQQAIAQQTLIDNMNDVATGIYYEVEDAKSSIESMETELASLQDQFKEVNVDIASSNGLISFSDDDYSKYGKAMENALTSAGIEFEKNASAGLYTTAIQLASASPQQLEQAQKFYDAWLNSENEYYHASENGLKQDIEEKEKSIETSYAKMTANLQAWVKDNYNYQYLSDDASAMVDALIPEIKWDELEEAPITASDYQNYVEENIIKPLMEVPQEHKQEIDNMLQQLLSFEDGDLDVLEFAEQLQARLKELGITIDITPIIADEQEAKDKLQNSIEAIAEGGSSDFTTSSGVKVDADDYKTLQEYTKDFTSDQIELWNKSTLGAENATDAINKYEEALKSASNPDEITVLGIPETVSALNTQLKPAMDSLSEVWGSIFEDGFNLKDIDLEAFSSIQSELDEMANKGLDMSEAYSSFNDFVTILNDTTSAEEDVRDAFDDLSTEIVKAGVQGNESFQLMKDTLQELGVQNYEVIAFQELVDNTKALKESGLDLANATYEQMEAFAQEKLSAEYASQGLYTLLMHQILIAKNPLDTMASIQNLIALGGKAAEVGSMLAELAQIMAQISNLQTYIANNPSADLTLVESTLSGLQKRADSLKSKITIGAEIEDKVDYSPVIDGASKAGKDAAEEYKKALEKELSDLDSVIGHIGDIIGDQIDLFNEQKDAAVDALESQKKAAEEAIEAEKDLVQAQIDGIQAKIDAKQKEIDAINEASEERKREIELQKAQFDLLRQQNQKSVLLFKDGQMQYDTDLFGIRDARESVTQAKESIKIAGIEKEISTLETEIKGLEDVIDSLDEKIENSNKYYDSLIESTEKYWDGVIKGLEDYKSRWDELKEIEEKAEMEVIFNELGISTEEVLNMSDSAFQAFKEHYLALLTEIHSGSDEMVTALKEVADSADFAPLDKSLQTTKENLDNLGKTDLSSVSTGLSNTASSAETLNTNTEGVDENLSGISDSLNTMPESTKVSNLATAFKDLATEIKNVADALGIGADASVSGLVQALTEISELSLGDADKELGIIAQFGNLKAKVDEVTNAISGSGSSSASSKGTNNVASGIAQAGLNANAESGSANSLTGAIEEMAQKAEESLGNGGDDSEEGTIGRFNALKTAVQNVIDLIGTEANTSGSAEGAENLISAIQLQYDRATEILPLEKLLFEELLTTIQKCVVSLNKMVSAFNSIAELGGMPTLPNGGGGGSHSSNSGSPHGGGGSSRGYAEGTVGKAFANGTGGYNGLPHDEKSALRSEYGQPELTVYPDGTTELTTEPTMSDLPKDTVIFNEEQTKQIMNNKGTVLGNAYADGTDNLPIIQKVEIPSYLRPLQEGDKGYELTQKFLAHQDKLINQIIPPVTAIERNMELLTKNISNVNTNTVNKPSYSVGDIHVNCTGITSQEVAKEVGVALKKEFFGMSNYAYQKSSITR